MLYVPATYTHSPVIICIVLCNSDAEVFQIPNLYKAPLYVSKFTVDGTFLITLPQDNDFLEYSTSNQKFNNLGKTINLVNVDLKCN